MNPSQSMQKRPLSHKLSKSSTETEYRQQQERFFSYEFEIPRPLL